MYWGFAGFTDQSYRGRLIPAVVGIVACMKRLWIVPALALIILSGCGDGPVHPETDTARKVPTSLALP